MARFDGTALYEHYDEKQGEHPDWGTHIFNYGRLEVKNFLISNALFWLENTILTDLELMQLHQCCTWITAKDGEWIPNRWGERKMWTL